MLLLRSLIEQLTIKRNSRILNLTRLGEKPNEGVNNNLFESYNLRSMFTKIENVTEIDAQLNSPPPLFLKFRFTTN